MEQTFRDQRGAEESRANVAKVWKKLLGIREEQIRGERMLLRYRANIQGSERSRVEQGEYC
jgi:hypothetical protein